MSGVAGLVTRSSRLPSFLVERDDRGSDLCFEPLVAPGDDLYLLLHDMFEVFEPHERIALRPTLSIPTFGRKTAYLSHRPPNLGTGRASYGPLPLYHKGQIMSMAFKGSTHAAWMLDSER